MAEFQLRGHTIRSHGWKLALIHIQNWMILVLLGLIDSYLNQIHPFHRYVNKDMMTYLKFPYKQKQIVPALALPIISILVPCIIFTIYYIYKRDVYDLHHAVLGLLYSDLVTGVITDSVKKAIGRPRPDFYLRCFPAKDEQYNITTGDVLCNGVDSTVQEGYQSFPSGHASYSFAGLGFLAWYLCGKIQVFDRRGYAAKLCIVLLPYIFATMVGISRIDDYWHHWTDVVTGAFLGTVVSAVFYLLFFPFPTSTNGWAPYAYFKMLEENDIEASPATTGGLTVPALEAMESGKKQ